MIVPNKVIPLSESALGLAPQILGKGPRPTLISELFRSLEEGSVDIDEFLLAIDLLFVLGRIEVEPSTGMVTYAR